MGYGNQPGNVVETALPGLGRLAAFVKGERIFTKNREQIFFARVETGLVYLCAENERYDRSILRFFRPGDWFSGDMLLQIPHGVSYLMAKYSTTLRVFSPEEMEDRLTMHRAYLAAEQAGLPMKAARLLNLGSGIIPHGAPDVLKTAYGLDAQAIAAAAQALCANDREKGNGA